MDSFQKRTEEAIERIAKDANYTVSRDASYGNVGTLRFHDGGSVDSLHRLHYSFQGGYASFTIDGDEKAPSLFYYDAGKGKTVADFLDILEDLLS